MQRLFLIEIRCRIARRVQQRQSDHAVFDAASVTTAVDCRKRLFSVRPRVPALCDNFLTFLRQSFPAKHYLSVIGSLLHYRRNHQFQNSIVFVRVYADFHIHMRIVLRQNITLIQLAVMPAKQCFHNRTHLAVLDHAHRGLDLLV